MTPKERTMPQITAHWTGKVWQVALPGGRTKTADTKGGIERIVARDAYGASVRFVGKDA